MFAGIGLPGFSGFIGEFLSLLGTFVVRSPVRDRRHRSVSIFAAVYSLWAFQRAFTGKPQGENAKMRDVTVREVIVVAPLLALSLFLGLYPKPALDRIEPSVREAVEQPRAQDRLPRARSRPAIVESIEGAQAPSDGEGGEVIGGGERRSPTPPRRLAGDRAGAGARRRRGARRAAAAALLRQRPGATPAAFAVAAVGVLAAGGLLIWQWFHVRDDGPISTMTGMVRVDALRRVPRHPRRHRDRARAAGRRSRT